MVLHQTIFQVWDKGIIVRIGAIRMGGGPSKV